MELLSTELQKKAYSDTLVGISRTTNSYPMLFFTEFDHCKSYSVCCSINCVEYPTIL